MKTFRKSLGVLIVTVIIFFMIDWLTNNPVKNSSSATVNMYCLGALLLWLYFALYVVNAWLLISGSNSYSTPVWLYLVLSIALCVIYGSSLVETATSTFSIVARCAFFLVLPVTSFIDCATLKRM